MSNMLFTSLLDDSESSLGRSSCSQCAASTLKNEWSDSSIIEKTDVTHDPATSRCAFIVIEPISTGFNDGLYYASL